MNTSIHNAFVHDSGGGNRSFFELGSYPFSAYPNLGTTMNYSNQTLARRDQLLSELSQMSGSDILKKIMVDANRNATILCAEGSVRLKTGNFVLPEELERLRANI
jgi:hypothetical protein